MSSKSLNQVILFGVGQSCRVLLKAISGVFCMVLFNIIREVIIVLCQLFSHYLDL